MAVIVFVSLSLVPLLQQLRRTAHVYEEIGVVLKAQLDPTLHEAQGLVRDASSVARRIDTDLKVVSRIVEDVSDTTAYAKELAGLVKEEVERPVLGMISTIAGLRRGVEAYRGYRAKNRAPRNPLRHSN